jgi:hypothetical protein
VSRRGNHSGRRAGQRPCAAVLAALLAAFALASASVGAQPRITTANPPEPRDPGEFEVITATHELIDGVYRIDAFVYLRLPTRAIEALHGGVELTVRFEVEFLRKFRMWWDPVVHPISQRWQLSYDQAIERYLVYNVNIQRSRTFVSLTEALRYMGQIDSFAALDATVLDDDNRYSVRVRASLDKEALVGPVRFVAIFLPDWSIESDWEEWDLQGN